jgi:hypothetical protein
MAMPTFDDVSRIVTKLPGVTTGVRYGTGTWQVGKHVFAWVRPLSKADIKRFGAETPPTGAILAVSVADLHDKQAVLAEGHRGVFTIVHFDNYPAVLVQLDVVAMDVLRDLVVDAWMVSAPNAVVDEYVAQHPLD